VAESELALACIDNVDLIRSVDDIGEHCEGSGGGDGQHRSSDRAEPGIGAAAGAEIGRIDHQRSEVAFP